MDELFKLLPPKYVALATFLWVLTQNAGRLYHAVKAEGGWRGVRNALLFGTNTPIQSNETKPPTG